MLLLGEKLNVSKLVMKKKMYVIEILIMNVKKSEEKLNTSKVVKIDHGVEHVMKKDISLKNLITMLAKKIKFTVSINQACAYPNADNYYFIFISYI